MKKLLSFVMTLAVVLTACKKEENPNVSLEGNQWISAAFEADETLPAGMYLYDFGAKSGAGKYTFALVVTQSNSKFKEGDLILLSEGDYTYDASSGIVTTDGEDSLVEYMSGKMIRLSDSSNSSNYMILSLVEGKQYPVKEAVELPEEFAITPSTEADWAGGSITFSSDRTIANLTYEVVTEGLTEKGDLCETSLSDNTLTLGYYLGSGQTLANCQIKVKATDEEGNKAECVVTSKAWMPAVYTESNGKYTQVDLKNLELSGGEYYLGALCADGEIPYDREANSFSGIIYELPVFMKPFGSKDNKIACETDLVYASGKIKYIYGALAYVISVDVS